MRTASKALQILTGIVIVVLFAIWVTPGREVLSCPLEHGAYVCPGLGFWRSGGYVLASMCVGALAGFNAAWAVLR